MCAGDDHHCPQFELHRRKLLDDLDAERRSFLKSAFVATGGAAALGASGGSLISPAMAQTAAARQGRPNHHYLPATADTVHWGYFSKLLKPQLEVDSGYLRHHRGADAPRQRRRRAHGQGRSRVGPLFGFIFPVGGMQGYLNVKAYAEFDGRDRPDGWNTWVTLSISPAGPAPAAARPMLTK